MFANATIALAHSAIDNSLRFTPWLVRLSFLFQFYSKSHQGSEARLPSLLLRTEPRHSCLCSREKPGRSLLESERDAGLSCNPLEESRLADLHCMDDSGEF